MALKALPVPILNLIRQKKTQKTALSLLMSALYFFGGKKSAISQAQLPLVEAGCTDARSR